MRAFNKLAVTSVLLFALPFISGAARPFANSNVVRFRLATTSTTTDAPASETTNLVATTAVAQEEKLTTGGATDEPTEAATDAPVDSTTTQATSTQASPPKCVVKCRKPTQQEFKEGQGYWRRSEVPPGKKGRRTQGSPGSLQSLQQPDLQSVSMQNSQGGQVQVQQQQQQQQGGVQGGQAQEMVTLEVPAEDLNGPEFVDGPDDGPHGGPFGGDGGLYGGGPGFSGPGFPFSGPGFRLRRFGRRRFFGRWKRSLADGKDIRSQRAGNKFWICEETC